VQRLFSTFADGWPGGGLLLQRFLAGGVLVYCGVGLVTAAPHFEPAARHILGAAAGALLLAGLWTPVAGAVIAIVEAWIAFSQPGNPWMPLMLAVLGASLAMIGPGAWSVDARLFGRKQISPEL
jgi:putative oxidoreductase